MQVSVHFYSYFKDLTGCAEMSLALAPGNTIASLFAELFVRFPKLEALQQSTLVAVGVEYQDRSYVLQEGDAVSLFPPVQGG